MNFTPLDADQFILGCFFRFHKYEFYRFYLSLIYSCVVASLIKMIWLCFSLLIFWFSKSCQHLWCFLNLVFLSALYLYFSIYSLFLLYLSLGVINSITGVLSTRLAVHKQSFFKSPETKWPPRDKSVFGWSSSHFSCSRVAFVSLLEVNPWQRP